MFAWSAFATWLGRKSEFNSLWSSSSRLARPSCVRYLAGMAHSKLPEDLEQRVLALAPADRLCSLRRTDARAARRRRTRELNTRAPLRQSLSSATRTCFRRHGWSRGL